MSDLPELKVEHDAWDTGFRIRVSFDVSHQSLEDSRESDVEATLAPVLRERMDAELAKEVRPYALRDGGVSTFWWRDFDRSASQLIMRCRGTYGEPVIDKEPETGA